VKLKEKQKKDFIIISKTDFAYLQNYIIESAVFVARMDADTAAIALLVKMIMDIRTVSKK
jgi:hypothetical protein